MTEQRIYHRCRSYCSHLGQEKLIDVESWSLHAGYTVYPHLSNHSYRLYEITATGFIPTQSRTQQQVVYPHSLDNNKWLNTQIVQTTQNRYTTIPSRSQQQVVYPRIQITITGCNPTHKITSPSYILNSDHNNCSRCDIQIVYWKRINANGGAPNDLFSWKRKKTMITWWNTSSHFSGHLINNNNNLLTLLAVDPSPSCPEWVLLYLFSCFPHLCWTPTDSFPWSRAVLALHSPLSADLFQEALDPGNYPFFCWAQQQVVYPHILITPTVDHTCQITSTVYISSHLRFQLQLIYPHISDHRITLSTLTIPDHSNINPSEEI